MPRIGVPMMWFAVAAVAQQAASPSAAGVVRGLVVDEHRKPIAGVAYGWTGWQDFVDTTAFLEAAGGHR